MKRIIIALLSYFILLSLVSCNNSAENTVGFYAVFLNTGKADCIIIRMDDMTILCDTAKKGDYTLITSALSDLGIETIDCMILTHFDKDHIGSAGTLLHNYDIKTVYAPDAQADSDAYGRLTSALSQKGMALTLVKEDVVLNTKNGDLHIFPPHNPDPDNDNSYSLITRITYKGSSMLLTGDATKKRLAEFLDDDDTTLYEIIKMPHHGEYTKSLATLLSRAGAKYGIVTCDSDRVTLELKTEKAAVQYGTELLFTYDGDITVTHDGSGFVINR